MVEEGDFVTAGWTPLSTLRRRLIVKLARRTQWQWLWSMYDRDVWRHGV